MIVKGSKISPHGAKHKVREDNPKVQPYIPSSTLVSIALTYLILQRCAICECRNKQQLVLMTVRHRRIEDEEESRSDSMEENIVPAKMYVTSSNPLTAIDASFTHMALIIVLVLETHKSNSKNSQSKLHCNVMQLNHIALKNGRMIPQEETLYQLNRMLSACDISRA